MSKTREDDETTARKVIQSSDWLLYIGAARSATKSAVRARPR
jgi:hypothetical protein